MQDLRTQVQRLITERDLLEKQKTSVEDEISALESNQEVLAEVCTLFQELISSEITSSVELLNQLQTKGLRDIFSDQDLAVRADVGVSRGKVSIAMNTVQRMADGSTVEGLSKDSFGGSVMAIQSVLLRIILILKFNLRKVLLLDESLPAFDENYVGEVSHFLNSLCEELGMDILLITHNPILMEGAKTSYRIQNKGGVATFRKREK